MPEAIDEVLSSYGDSDYSVRLVRAVCNVVPFAPDLPPVYSVVEILTNIDEKAGRSAHDAAHEKCRTEEFERALWMVRAMDTAGTGIGVYSGISSAYKLYKSEEGERLDALETDPQQAADAVLKALALCFIIYKIFPGGPLEKVNAFRETKAGQAMLFYFAAIEVGLPFADNALVGSGQMMASLWEKFGPQETEKLAAIAGEEEAKQAAGIMSQLMGPVNTMSEMASTYLKPVAEAVTTHLPTAVSGADKAAGAAATAADLLPVYKFLGTRLVAEAACRQALAEQAEKKEAAVSSSPANVEIKYTRSAESELPAAPEQKRGCLPFFVVLLVLGGASVSLLA